MATVPVIDNNAITMLSQVGDRPVFFVTLQGKKQATLVIKGEKLKKDTKSTSMVTATSVEWGSKLMKNINAGKLVNVKVLQPNEITEFKRAAGVVYANDLNMVNGILNSSHVWVKMLKIDGLTDAQIIADASNNQEDREKVSRVIGQLLGKGVWYQLGRVIAVDIFNGNEDRFDTQGDWINQGNLMFANNAVIGLDTFDPSSNRSNLLSNNSYKALEILKASKGTERRELAKKITINVSVSLASALTRSHGVFKMAYIQLANNQSAILTPENIQTLFVNDDVIGELVLGMEDGIRDLKIYLNRKVNSYRQQARQGSTNAIPPGVLGRMAFLGWNALVWGGR